MSVGNFREILSRQILAGIILVGILMSIGMSHIHKGWPCDGSWPQSTASSGTKVIAWCSVLAKC